jgi:hypothetical protein
MATSDNPFVTVPKTDTDEPEDHDHNVPIVNIEDDGDRETLEYEPPEDVKIEEEEAVLLELDEADALFGNRGGVKDGHGRY